MTSRRGFRFAQAIGCEVLVDGLLCFVFFFAVRSLEHLSDNAGLPTWRGGVEIAALAFYYCVMTLSVRAVTHTPWHFLLRYRAARTHGFAWRRTLGLLAGTYALAYLVGIAVTGGVLWEALVTQGWKAVLPSFAAALTAPLVAHRLLGELLDSLAAEERPAAKPP